LEPERRLPLATRGFACEEGAELAPEGGVPAGVVTSGGAACLVSARLARASNIFDRPSWKLRAIPVSPGVARVERDLCANSRYISGVITGFVVAMRAILVGAMESILDRAVDVVTDRQPFGDGFDFDLGQPDVVDPRFVQLLEGRGFGVGEHADEITRGLVFVGPVGRLGHVPERISGLAAQIVTERVEQVGDARPRRLFALTLRQIAGFDGQFAGMIERQTATVVDKARPGVSADVAQFAGIILDAAVAAQEVG
jgi:hypothetical protein